MNLKKLILAFIIFSLPSVSFSQSIVNFKIPNPVLTEKKFASFEAFMVKARDAYKENNYEKCLYYIKNAEKNGLRNSEFYFYLGVSTYHLGKVVASKRYLKRGYNDYGCYECKEAMDQIHNVSIKSRY